MNIFRENPVVFRMVVMRENTYKEMSDLLVLILITL